MIGSAGLRKEGFKARPPMNSSQPLHALLQEGQSRPEFGREAIFSADLENTVPFDTVTASSPFPRNDSPGTTER